MSAPRILITRTRDRASELAVQLELLGAETILIPTIEIAPPASFKALDGAIDSLAGPDHDIDWLLFTSANAVHALHARSSAAGRKLHPKRVGAVGPATAKAVVQCGLVFETAPVLLPPKYVAESLAEALLAEAGSTPQHFLLVRAEEARDIIPEALRAAGHQVTIAPAYRNVTPDDTLPALGRIFSDPGSYPDVITFTSSSTATNLVALLESLNLKLPAGIALASIGPITSKSLRALGHEPSFEATEPTIDSLVDAISQHLVSHGQLERFSGGVKVRP